MALEYNIDTDTLEEFMRQSTSEAEWNDRCDAVKEAHGNQYPWDWLPRIVLSGIAGEAAGRFKS